MNGATATVAGALVLALAGCPPLMIATVVLGASAGLSGNHEYRADSLVREKSGRRVGCVDMAAAKYVPRDMDLGYTAFAVEWSLGNRCYAPSPFDLRAVRAWAEDARGQKYDLEPVDPRNELRALEMESLVATSEVVEYHLHDPAAVDVKNVSRACFDVTDTSPEAASRDTTRGPLSPICIVLPHGLRTVSMQPDVP